jgi:serine O-acetyltransferase
MRDLIKGALMWVSAVRLIPHIVLMLACSGRAVVCKDIERWGQVMSGVKPASAWQRLVLFVRLMTFNPEYRNLFYHRTGLAGMALSVLCRPMPSLYIHTKRIGPGLFIQHGFATIIAAAEIGENCWVNQQVTLGFSSPTDSPTLGDNVTISAGAKVIGRLTIGSNCQVGANAVVVKNVPPNCTVVGVPAYIVRKDGVKVRMDL